MKAIPLLTLLALAPLHAEQVNLVEKGREIYQLWGCATCHAVDKDDASIKTGPTLYNLFQLTPREREVFDIATNQKITVKADRDYFIRSVREPADHLAYHESGPTKGEYYPNIMPRFTDDVVSDENLGAIWHYVLHQAEEGKNGPAVVMGEITTEKIVSEFENASAVLVAERPRVIRAPLEKASGRAIHTGLPNGMNYTFDPRFFSVRRVWTGGFLDLTKEHTGRSTPGSDLGLNSSIVLDDTPLLVPLTAAGKAIDLEFKEPDVNDEAAAQKHLEKGGDFLKILAEWDSGFQGYKLSENGEPTFHFRIGKNYIRQQISFDDEGRLIVEISGKLATEQVFQLRETGLEDITTEGGTLDGKTWTLPAGENQTHRLSAKITSGLVARAPLPVAENLAPQPATTTPAEAVLPAGYTVENWTPPTDTFGRAQLFEPTAISLAKDGTVVVGTRTAGIWKWKDNTWSLFAEGTFECLGIVIEDDNASTIVISQKPEITRLRDTNGNGRADSFETLSDHYGFHGNYHEYTHGPVRDEQGNYYFLLNLSHSRNDDIGYKAGGQFMSNMGGFRGWACRVTPDGTFELFASGLRSPAGLGVDPEGRLVYTENQGEYCGSSKVQYLVKDAFYSHPSSLVSLPGMTPDSPELNYDLWKDKAHPAALWFPHSKLANSPGNPAWDLTDGKFGPYATQMFVGDQTLSTLVRVASERIGETDQGTMILFGREFSSGIMRPCFLPDGSLLLGQTGRGWRAKGGSVASLQRVIYDGETIPADILSINTRKDGLTVNFTTSLKPEVTAETFLANAKIESWTYTDSSNYGSRENEKRANEIAAATISDDRKSIHLQIPDFAEPAQIIDRIYHLQLNKAADHFTATPVFPELQAFQTIRILPD